MSAEGTTQGCPMAMPAYGIGILPLLLLIKEDDPILKHVAYADDIGGGSRLKNLRDWWNRVVMFGPYLGYYPKPSKSWLVVKAEKEEEARVIFEGTGIQITTEGRSWRLRRNPRRRRRVREISSERMGSAIRRVIKDWPIRTAGSIRCVHGRV